MECVRKEGRKMFHRPEFFGSTTVGERGQIVLPAKMRHEFSIHPGDRLLVLGTQGKRGIILVKAEVLSEMMSNMAETFSKMNQEIEGSLGKTKDGT